MNKKTKFIILAILVALGRFYDVFTTSLYIPDLKNETNIIVSLLGGGWTIVLILQIILTATIIFCLYYYFYKYLALEKPKYYSNFLDF